MVAVQLLRSMIFDSFSYQLTANNFSPLTYATRLGLPFNSTSFFFELSEARGKLKKLLVPLLLALKFKSAVILPIVFTILALVSLKALKVGLIALMFAGKFVFRHCWVRFYRNLVGLFIHRTPWTSNKISTFQAHRSSKTSSPRNKRRSQLPTSQLTHKTQDSTPKSVQIIKQLFNQSKQTFLLFSNRLE